MNEAGARKDVGCPGDDLRKSIHVIVGTQGMHNDHLHAIVRCEIVNDAEIVSGTARPRPRELAFQFVRMQR